MNGSLDGLDHWIDLLDLWNRWNNGWFFINESLDLWNPFAYGSLELRNLGLAGSLDFWSHWINGNWILKSNGFYCKTLQATCLEVV
jgi:hypothetical protein